MNPMLYSNTCFLAVARSLQWNGTGAKQSAPTIDRQVRLESHSSSSKKIQFKTFNPENHQNSPSTQHTHTNIPYSNETLPLPSSSSHNYSKYFHSFCLITPPLRTPSPLSPFPASRSNPVRILADQIHQSTIIAHMSYSLCRYLWLTCIHVLTILYLFALITLPQSVFVNRPHCIETANELSVSSSSNAHSSMLPALFVVFFICWISTICTCIIACIRNSRITVSNYIARSSSALFVCLERIDSW